MARTFVAPLYRCNAKEIIEMNRILALFLVPAALALPDRVVAEDGDALPDYSSESTWLCKPGRLDACAIDINATAISGDGEHQVEPFTNDSADKPVDCFYVYPTVSMQDADNSDMTPESPQFARVRTQLARYGTICRLFAPMYRQVTLKVMARYATDLKAFDPNAVLAAAPQYRTAYSDVVAAWKYYLEHENNGRGVILIGHSQGAFILRDLIKAEIDGKEVQNRLVSAHLAGTVVAQGVGKGVPDEFKTIKPCATGAETNCFISFSTFAASAPPPAWSHAFGMIGAKNTVNNCSNPADLSGDGGTLIPYIDRSRPGDDGREPVRWTADGRDVDTPLVSLPSFYKAKCLFRDDGAGYLAIDFAAGATDTRTKIVPGHVHVGPIWLSNWGTHDADMELTIGNLVKIAAMQSTSWQKAHKNP